MLAAPLMNKELHTPNKAMYNSEESPNTIGLHTIHNTAL